MPRPYMRMTMSDILIILIALIWLAGTCLRIYRQARFYQIEEYMSGRYLRWLFGERERGLPTRPAVAGALGAGLGIMLAEGGQALPTLIAIIAALVAVYPPDEGEIKKPLRLTARAKRLLGASFAIAILAMLVALLLLSRVDLGSFTPIGIGAVGLMLFLFAPLALVAGSILMIPVEAAFRQMFVERARRALEDVHPTVIGITGSYGKTSTKSYLAHILNGRYHAYPTPKSYNTLMGVCLAINNDVANNHSIEYFIAEMGAYVPGEIRQICELVQPTISIVVEVGPQHLERFGTLENTAQAKYEIIRALPPDGVGVFNWDNPYIREMIERGYPATRLGVSREADPANVPDGVRFVASDIGESLDGLRFTVTDAQTGAREDFATPLLGIHNVTNLLLATAVAVHEGMTLREITQRVRTLQPAESRLTRQVTAQGITIINDAYSANPVGVVGALRVLSLHNTGRRLLITPGMVELGERMEPENRKLGKIAAAHATDVILVGRQTAPIRDGLLAAGFPPDRLQTVGTLAESVAWYQSNLRSGDTVLFLNDLPDTYSS
ncbi:MAG: UDP-N-acetylmuramoyl-tripeptide--D-alanyl-D-alanine ligase [Anaerolineae bacterium]|nr:UDP-N-acetylmuramoyl-tripeptide--D-alanyl-D-alanine ligase [Anaerolineae bacterium]